MNKRVTIMDVARAVGMSPASVSIVLSGNSRCNASKKTQILIRDKARELGYRPNVLAQGLKKGRTRMIGVISSSMQNEVKNRMVCKLVNRLLSHGYISQVIYDLGEKRLRIDAYDRLMDIGCDAVVVTDSLLYEGELEKIDSFSYPMFLISNRLTRSLPGRTIFLDYKAGCDEGLRHLEELGHKNILFVTRDWNEFQDDYRYISFCEYCKTAANCVGNVVTLSNYAEITADDVRKVLVKHPDITAIVTENDLYAMSLARQLQKLGYRVPEDISLIGFDDIPATEIYTPALSTIHQPVERAAEAMTQLVMNELEGTHYQVETRIPCCLVRRESTALARRCVEKCGVEE